MSFQDDINEALGSTDDDGYIPALVAGELVANANPAELAEWLREHAASIITEYLGQRRRSVRSRLNARVKAVTFSQEALKDQPDFSPYRVPYTVDDKGTVKPLGKLRRADLLFVADDYDRDGKNSLMLAAFHRSIAKKVGTKTVAEAITPDAYNQMLLKFTERLAS